MFRFNLCDPLDRIMLRLVLLTDDVGIFTVDAEPRFFSRAVDRHPAFGDRRPTLGNEIHDLIMFGLDRSVTRSECHIRLPHG